MWARVGELFRAVSVAGGVRSSDEHRDRVRRDKIDRLGDAIAAPIQVGFARQHRANGSRLHV